MNMPGGPGGGEEFGSGFIRIDADLDPLFKSVDEAAKRIANRKPIPVQVGPSKQGQQAAKGATDALKKVDDAQEDVAKGSKFTADQQNKLAQALIKSTRTGGALAASLNRLGLSSLPLGETAGRILGIGAALQTAGPALEQLKGVMAGIGPVSLAVAAGVAVAGAAIFGMVKFAQMGYKELKILDATMSKVAFSLQATGQAAVGTGAAFAQMLDSISDLKGIPTNEVRDMGLELLKVTDLRGEEFRRAWEEAGNVLIRTGLNGQQAGQLLAQALKDPSAGVDVLANSIVGFNDDIQETVDDLLAIGDRAGALTVILDEVARAQEGTEAAAGTWTDTQRRLQKTMQDLREEAAEALAPAFEDLVAAGKALYGAINELLSPIGGVKGLFVAAVVAIRSFAMGLRLGAEALQGFMRLMAPLKTLLESVLAPFRALGSLLGPVLRAIGVDTEALKGNLQEIVLGAGEGGRALKGLADSAAGAIPPISDLTENQKRLVEQQKTLADQAFGLRRSQHSLMGAQRNAAKATKERTEAEQELLFTLEGYPSTHEKAIEAVDKHTDATFNYRQSQLGIREADLAREKSLFALSEAQEEYNKTISGYGPESLEYKKAVLELEKAELDLVKTELERERIVLRISRAERQLARDQKLRALVAKAYGENTRFTEIANEHVKDSELSLAEVRLSQRENALNLIESQQDLTEAQYHATGILRGYAEGSKEAREATWELRDSQLAAESAAIRVEQSHVNLDRATRNLSEATRVLNGTLGGFPPTSKEAQDASTKLEDAMYNQQGAVLAAEGAQRDLNEAMEEYNELLKKTLDLEKNLARQRAEQEASEPRMGLGTRRSGFGWSVERQHGGNVRSRQVALVGEGGPELWIPDRPGRIYPSNRVSLGSGGPQSLRLSLDINPQPVMLTLDGRVVAAQVLPRIRKEVRQRL